MLILALLLIVIGFFFIDKPISLWCSTLSHADAKMGKVLSYLISPEIHLTLWPVLFLLFFYFLKNKKVGSRLFLIVVALPASLVVCDTIKVVFGRVRPYAWLKTGEYGFTWFATKQKFFSFPSSHACTIGAIMGALSCFLPRYRLLWIVSAFCLSTPRLFALDHFLSDIITGITVGFVVTYLIDKKMHDSLLQLSPWRKS